MKKQNSAHLKLKKQDEYYTPKMLVDFLPKILKEYNIKNILCPFDKKESNFVKILSKDFNIINGHIDENKDFFDEWYKDLDFDIIVSNPPFSRKMDILRLCLERDYKFMLILNLMCLNHQEIGNILSKFDKIGLIIPDKKVSYDGNTCSFCSAYITNLFNKNIFINLPHNNSRKFYNPEN